MPLQNSFIKRYPEFKNADPEQVGIFIEDAKAEISEKHWGRLYERGVMALTAHLLRISFNSKESQGGAIRPISSETAGELSVSYTQSISNPSDDFYQTTAYGQEYLRLRKLIGVGIIVV
ncbi:DUF4054 domain-containing protein [Pasteurella multocida]|uniref:DUF4054 domain-containing protein n=1 Tax=Pasteurella multocida TaxID=747 RepID=UPI0033018E05|nr:DUF4054 domain-containing protein [Pasteurella multocida]HDR1014727.1 DUF4054 domain-containing protein [Pasteurella multocida]HDR1017681.1 DUF4054 domain-containing protein [Pasteurella multocida]HDR1209185.1 DUF4054 domain-containing protein [Pasteurella multocida]HDR1246191.1 DUF4054 domain-containing protein [Pasteurella multocida]